MTFTRLIVLGDSHPPENMAAHLTSAGTLNVEAGTSNRIPDLTDAALWVDTSGATRLHNAGIGLDLLSPGPGWLSTVPGHLLGRRVLCTTLGKLTTLWEGEGVFRLAEQKYGVLGTAKAYAGPAAFIRQFEQTRSGSPNLQFGARIIASAPVTYKDRYRIFIANGEISASTRMAVKSKPGQRREYYLGNAPDQIDAAEHFAQKVIDGTVWHQPPGFAIEVGQAADGSWQLIHATPSWSADPLEGNPSGVVAAVLAAQVPDYHHWKWTPDEMFQRIIFPSWPAPAS